MFINTQAELLRDPNLLVPGKKPIGAVKIDDAHWIAPACIRAYVQLAGTGYVDLVTGDILQGSSDAPHGGDMDVSNTAFAGTIPVAFPDDYFAIMWRTEPHTVANYNCEIQCGDWAKGFVTHTESGGSCFAGRSPTTAWRSSAGTNWRTCRSAWATTTAS